MCSFTVTLSIFHQYVTHLLSPPPKVWIHTVKSNSKLTWRGSNYLSSLDIFVTFLIPEIIDLFRHIFKYILYIKRFFTLLLQLVEIYFLGYFKLYRKTMNCLKALVLVMVCYCVYHYLVDCLNFCLFVQIPGGL